MPDFGNAFVLEAWIVQEAAGVFHADGEQLPSEAAFRVGEDRIKRSGRYFMFFGQGTRGKIVFVIFLLKRLTETVEHRDFAVSQKLLVRVQRER